MKLLTNNLLLSNELLDDVSIKFDTIDECVEFKQRLIAFIKSKKRDVRDRAIIPELTFNILKTKTNE